MFTRQKKTLRKLINSHRFKASPSTKSIASDTAQKGVLNTTTTQTHSAHTCPISEDHSWCPLAICRWSPCCWWSGPHVPAIHWPTTDCCCAVWDRHAPIPSSIPRGPQHSLSGNENTQHQSNANHFFSSTKQTKHSLRSNTHQSARKQIITHWSQKNKRTNETDLTTWKAKTGAVDFEHHRPTTSHKNHDDMHTHAPKILCAEASIDDSASRSCCAWSEYNISSSSAPACSSSISPSTSSSTTACSTSDPSKYMGTLHLKPFASSALSVRKSRTVHTCSPNGVLSFWLGNEALSKTKNLHEYILQEPSVSLEIQLPKPQHQFIDDSGRVVELLSFECVVCASDFLEQPSADINEIVELIACICCRDDEMNATEHLLSPVGTKLGFVIQYLELFQCVLPHLVERTLEPKRSLRLWPTKLTLTIAGPNGTASPLPAGAPPLSSSSSIFENLWNGYIQITA